MSCQYPSAAGVLGLSRVAAKAESIRIRRASDYLGEVNEPREPVAELGWEISA
jgi:hypothetical protein